MTVLADIERMIADYQPPADPFNGATNLVMSPDVFRALAPHLEEYASNPLIRPRIEIDIRPTMPPPYAMGFRGWRDGDDPELQFLGPVLVWFVGPRQADNAETKTSTPEKSVSARMERKPAFWTHDDKAAREHRVGHLYYFAPEGRTAGPYTVQREVRAIIDIAADGTLAGVELIDGMPPPPGWSTENETRDQ